MLGAGLVALGLVCATAGEAYAQQPAATSPTAIDGPTDIPSPSGLGLSVARDGTGGLVYLKQVGGIPHVFVSLLAGGVFREPLQVDAGLAGASSQPVIAAGQDGLLLVSFVNGGELYVTGRAAQGTPFSAPAGLAGGAINPSISISDFGKAYLAFAVADGSGFDVRAAYYYNGRWALESPPLNVNPADNSGTGSGAPAVATAGDGVGIVAWGEAGHVFSRRVWGTIASVVNEQADAAPPGCAEVAADHPVVGTEGDSSYAQVAFHEVVTCNGRQLSRVLANRLHGSLYDGVEAPDGLNASSIDGAVDPQITMGEYGHGWVTSVRSTAHDAFAAAMGEQGRDIGTTQVNALPNAASPNPVPATAGLYSTLIAWEQNPGSAGMPEVRVRYAPDGSTLGPDVVVSTPAQGPTDAKAGISAAGDVSGDAAVAWLQGTPGAIWVMAEQMYQPPGAISVNRSLRYENTSNPVLRWSAARELWGPMTYNVSVDGAQVAQTSAPAVRIPTTVADGPHSWQVAGTNPAGQPAQPGAGTLFVDTVPPAGAMRLYGPPLAKTAVHVYVNYIDRPPAGEPVTDASGVRDVVVRWGDGTVVRIKLGTHRSFHAYRRPGHYVIALLVTDRAGNSSRQVIRVAVLASKPKRKKHPTTPRSHPKTTPKPPATGGATPPTPTKVARK